MQPRQRLNLLAARTRATVRPYVLPLLGFVVVTAAVFAPLLARMTTGVLRGPTDGAQAIRQLWLLRQLGESPFSASRDPLLGAPEGVPLSPAVDVAQPVQPGVGWVLSHLLGDAAAFNLFLLTGFVATGLAVYVLLHRLELHPVAAFFGALVLTFNPWMIERALEGHAAFVHVWTLVLVVGALAAVHETRRPKHAVLVGGAFALCFFASAYLGLLAGLIVAVLFGVMLVQTEDWRGRAWAVWLFALGASTAVLLLMPAAVAYTRDRASVDAVAGHSSGELGSFSATLSSYLRPSAQHPLLGSLGIDPVLGSGNSERVLYFGFSTFALAALGALLVLRRSSGVRGKAGRFVLASMVVLAPAALLFSLPPRPTLLGIVIPMPSAILGELTSFYRVYARFGFVLGVALALLAAAAVSALLRSSRRDAALAWLGMALVVFEILPGRLPVWAPEPRLIDDWLARQPPGIVANYPMPTDQPQALALALEEQFLQRHHGQPLFPLVSGGSGGTREQGIRIASRYLHDPATPGLLAAEGVRYVLVHDDVFRSMREEPPAVPPGFHDTARLGDVRVLQLNADVAPAEIDAVLESQAAAIAAVLGLRAPTLRFDSGFSEEQQSSGWRSLGATGSVRLEVDDARLKRVTLILSARSLESPRTLELLDQAGAVVASAPIGPAATQIVMGPVAVSVPSTTLRLRTLPAGETLIGPIGVQPLADFSRSLRSPR